MILFLDTEFTGLGQRNPLLISLGLVSEDGRHTFYAELPPDTYLSECAPWVRENILPLLDGGDRILQPCELRQRLAEWISVLGNVRIVTDAPDYDFALLKAALGILPENVDPKAICFDSYTLGSAHQELLESYRAGYFRSGKPEHHALHDAQALRRTWQKAKPLDEFQAFATKLGL